ncbi:hypothetical protein QSJ18_18375 [Gordonia sp. ABSL1-1]|uniref:hypothetical protein n=1 Tax=Gordonia sp. ABSL1-1 TaxID=3053923 RepID=UPI0025725AC5|nr:hypothetical protein [Gordonia sp. ABSL1-1]MDL9938717.1 hypothetical protein [Gordonia sp. ABSL1-1]
MDTITNWFGAIWMTATGIVAAVVVIAEIVRAEPRCTSIDYLAVDRGEIVEVTR